jgi:hypothetical protein
MNVLIIPEDHTKDEHMLKPIVKAMLEYLGKSTATVDVCRNPRLQGVSQALNWEQIQEILDQYDWIVDLFLLCVNRDGEQGRKTRLTQLEEQAATVVRTGHKFLAENAWQEIEVWVLAGHDDWPSEWVWQQVRQERDSKEVYFLPYAQQRGLAEEWDQGRKTLAEEAARRYDKRIRKLCSEDVANLEGRVQGWMEEAKK